MSYHISYEHLGIALNDILSLIKPSQKDHEKREIIITEFESFITSLGMQGFTDAEVKPYGSFLYNLYTRKADIDVSVDIPNLSLSDGDAIGYIWNALVKRHYDILNFVPEARIPVVSFESKRWNITCDVTINNHMAQIKSKFLLWISKIDKRFCDMVLLVKEWARSHDINDPKEGTLNSYAICLLVIFHLQTCVPAILPPLKDIRAGSIRIRSRGMNSTEELLFQHICATNIERFISLRTVNRSTLAQLMVSFFEKFSQLESMAATRLISTYTGRWEDRSGCKLMARRANELIIQDPLELSDNAARTVQDGYINMISQAFNSTHNSLQRVAPSRTSYKACLLRE